MIDFAYFIFLNLLAMVSPGPDFAVVTRYGLAGSRRAALLATCGITVALGIHVLYCVSGVAVFLQKSPALAAWIKGICSIYLIFLGIKLMRECGAPLQSEARSLYRGAFLSGFVVNLFNPKATIFLLTLFTLFASSMHNLQMKVMYAVSIPLLALTWFAFVSYFLTNPRFLPWIQRRQKVFLFIMGMVLLCIGGATLYKAIL